VDLFGIGSLCVIWGGLLCSWWFLGSWGVLLRSVSGGVCFLGVCFLGGGGDLVVMM
jgi:hypothetical protein